MLVQQASSPGPVYVEAGNLSDTSNENALPLIAGEDDSVIPLPKFSFIVPKPRLLTAEQIEIELRKTESWGRIVRGEVDQAIPRCRSPTTFNVEPEVRKEIDFGKFKAWLYAQSYSLEHKKDIYRYALKFKDALLDARSTAELKALPLDRRRHVMQALAALSKFLGIYEDWKAKQKQVGLIWEKPGSDAIIRNLLSGEADRAYKWLKEVALAKLPKDYRVPLVYIAISGLRPSEACDSHRLVRDLDSKDSLFGSWNSEQGYIDKELSMICHFKFKQFSRDNKKCFISFVSPKITDILRNSKPFSYKPAVEHALLRYECLPRQTYGLRKFFATTLRKHVDAEMVNILQGRIDPSVFVKSYYRPLLIDLRKKTLAATRAIEDDLLSFL